MRDLESKGMIRTALETLNLGLQAKHPDVMMAECIRSFPTVTFPASLLLKREEVETRKVSGHSVIAPLHHGKGVSNVCMSKHQWIECMAYAAMNTMCQY